MLFCAIFIFRGKMIEEYNNKLRYCYSLIGWPMMMKSLLFHGVIARAFHANADFAHFPYSWASGLNKNMSRLV